MIEIKSILFDPALVQNVIYGLIASAIYGVCEHIISLRYRKQILALFMKWRWGLRARATLMLVSSGLIAVLAFVLTHSIIGALVAHGAIVSWMLWRQLFRLSNVGLIGVDQDIESGFDYDKALQLAENSIDFLGTGAHKLTTSPYFDEAVSRCNRPGRPSRFLLCHPANPILQTASTQSGLSPETYRHRVLTSLQKLAVMSIEENLTSR